MRRKKEEIIDREQIVSILQRARIGRLATNGADGFPYVIPVNFVFWRDSIYFHCARQGEKLDNIARDPRVCFTVDLPLAYIDSGFAPEKPPCEVSQMYQCVVVRGIAEIISEISEKVGALNAIMASHERVADYDRIGDGDKAVGLCEVVAIRIGKISGKANLCQKKSAEEKERIQHYLEKRALPGDIDSAALLK